MPVATSRASETAQDDDDPELKGDRRLLVLNDDGGIWQKHNEWLVGLEETTWVITLDSKQEVIPIKRATGGQISGQWVSVSADQTPLRLARARLLRRASQKVRFRWYKRRVAGPSG